MWSLGDYGELAPILEPAAEAIVERCHPDPSTRLLDVAAGTGNVAVIAAQRGAHVTASDLTPRMIELGRSRSGREGLDIDWVEADAEALPFADGRFDVVTSAFGAMFTPRPELAASELVRVTRPGGLVVMANYAADGFFGRLGSIVASNAPSGSSPPSPFLWADPTIVRGRFAGLVSEPLVAQRSARFAFDSIEEGWAMLERSNGPLNALHHIFGPEAYADARSRVLDLLAELNIADDGRVVIEWTYALVIAKRDVTSTGVSEDDTTPSRG